MKPPAPLRAPPQMHSRDYLIRVDLAHLGQIVFEHLCSEQDPSVLADAIVTHDAVFRAGTTEWQATISGGILSLAWDWAQVGAGDVFCLRQVAPRSNILVLDPQGYDLPTDCAAHPLWAKIEGLPWQAAVLEALSAVSQSLQSYPSCLPGATRH